jgi:hypothetical protein
MTWWSIMALDGSSATFSTEPHTDNTASSCDGRGKESLGFQIVQIVIAQTTDFRWKVMVFSKGRCEKVEVFTDPDAMTIWVNDVSRLNNWFRGEPVGLG